jgi:16S rRNA (guanine(966)-N(2))-methyltransferase RsmD
MRVIAGEFRSRKLKAVPGLATRPTPDRLRESLFSILMPRIEGVVFLDLYAGTGAVGIEAISRGAARAIFIEKSKLAVEILQENLEALGALGRAKVIRGGVTTYLGAQQADIVFADPPYELEEEYGAVLEILGTNPPGLLILQHSSKVALAEEAGALRRGRVVRQGDNCLSFYEAV